MLNNISLGVYFPGDSLVHHLQARTKLLILLEIAIWLAIANQHQWHFAPMIAVVVLFCVGVALSGIAPKQIFQRIWLLLALSVIGAVPTLFSKEWDNKPLYPIGPFLVLHSTMLVF